MKITKTAAVIFFLTFLIGCISVVVYVASTQTQRTTAREPLITLPAPPPTPLPVPSKLEIIEEVKVWDESESQLEFEMLEVGEFHGDEVTAKSGEIWLGLFRENDGYFLRSTRIKVKTVPDFINEEMSGKKVSVKDRFKPIFLLKKAEFLPQNKITSLFHNRAFEETEDYVEDSGNLEKGFAQEHQLNGANFRLKVEEASNNKDEKILALLVELAEKQQVLYTMPSEYTNSLGSLLWAGDLDGDGKPDFLLSLYIKENITYRSLYLSSKAKNGKIVEKVAVFTTVGC